MAASETGVPFAVAKERRFEAARLAFELDPRAFSLGIGLARIAGDGADEGHWTYHLLCDPSVPIRDGAKLAPPHELLGIPVRHRWVTAVRPEHAEPRELETLSRAEATQAAAAGSEQRRVRPLVAGLEVANTTRGAAPGSIGCFVELGSHVALLSNNHVLAAANRGAAGDVVAQPRGSDGIGRLLPYPALQPLPSVNDADVALAVLDPDMPYENGFCLARRLKPLTGFLGDDTDFQHLLLARAPVFEVGMNGYAEGIVWNVLAQTRAIPYRGLGPCQFRDVTVCVHRRSPARQRFLEVGDSGSPIFTEEGRIVGIHFAGGHDPAEPNLRVSWSTPGPQLERGLQTLYSGFELRLAPGGTAP